MMDTPSSETSTKPEAPPKAEADRLQQARDALREREAERAREDEQLHMSGPGEAVDHERQPGVPPPCTDDYEDIVDIEGAESFPASDPPSNY